MIDSTSSERECVVNQIRGIIIMTKVHVDCNLPTLKETVSLMLAGFPTVELVEASDADIVVAWLGDPSGQSGPKPTFDDDVNLILFDPEANLLGIRPAGEGVEIIEGNLETVLEIILQSEFVV